MKTEGPLISNQFRKYWFCFPFKILHTQQLPPLQLFWVFQFVSFLFFPWEDF